jgi:hypothetical protein
MSTLILIAGLTVSLFGTITMTIPLISCVRVFFDFGKLKEAKQSLRYDRLEQGDVGFREIASRYLEIKEYGNKVDVDEIEYITHEPKLSADFINKDEEKKPKYTGSSETDLIFVKYSLNEDNDLGIGSSYNSEIHKFYQLFEPDMRQGEQKIRLIGLSLLGVGFLLQIFSLLI